MFVYVFQSPSPLCPYYRWIDRKQPEWAMREVNDRQRRAWESLDREERQQKAEAWVKAEQDRQMKEYRAEQVRFFRGMGRKNDEARLRMEEEERQRKVAREAERQRLKESAREAQAAEEFGDRKGKYPRWTQ